MHAESALVLMTSLACALYAATVVGQLAAEARPCERFAAWVRANVIDDAPEGWEI